MKSIGLAPVLSGNDRSGLVVDCPHHALPVGIILEEYRARRADELKSYVVEIFRCSHDSAWEELQKRLSQRNAKYDRLAECKADPRSLPGAIDELERECHDLDMPFKQLLHKMNGTAVCLSGGGIRSASFSLGILEGLARFSLGILHPKQDRKANTGLLQELDYISTVSGGGYIGSWLLAWVYRRRAAEIKRARAGVDATTAKLHKLRMTIEKAEKVSRWLRSPVAPLLRKWGGTAKSKIPEQEGGPKQELKGAQLAADEARTRLEQAKSSTWDASYLEVVKALAGTRESTSGDPAPQSVRHLREYTSYLAPARGLSLDSWDLVAIVVRNLLVNWLMLAPLLLAVVALPQASHYANRDLPPHLRGTASMIALALVLVLFVIAAIFAGCRLPSHRSAENTGPTSFWVAIGLAFPVLLGNWMIIELWRSRSGELVDLAHWRRAELVIFVIAWIGFGALASWLFRSYRRRILANSNPALVQGGRGFLLGLWIQTVALVCAATATALLRMLAGWVFPYLVNSHPAKFGFTPDDRLFTILALPLVALVPLISASLFSGLLGVFEQEEDREWLSRAGGIQLAVIAAWILVHTVALYATETMTAIYLAVGGALLGGAGSALGWSGATSAGPRPVKAAQLKTLGSFLNKHDLMLPTVCAVALLLLTLGAAGAEYALAGGLQASLSRHLLIFLASVLLALALNGVINVNLFSLHGMYRMRLMRAFLGASNTQRNPDSFTQFDRNDTPLEIGLPKEAGAPLHIINTTLNLVGTKDLAWRQRKAESFTFSPLHSGCWRLAYVPTCVYAGDDGISLATAMAISGAAFNPNMGYHSSPLVTLLMTFFNVRLGWWLPNPAREEGARWPWAAKGCRFLHKTGPAVALEPLILEAFGMTDDTYRWIELTDGGHFENLGLYEMVLRRCHNIIVVDAGADPKCQFEDLGNALRKVEIDLGIPIRFNTGIKMQEGAKAGNRYCAVATIDYACVDGDDKMSPAERASLAGNLIYIKAGISGKEPPDITQYALTHADFPHETTANQFFNESQFESYRHLGSYQVETIVNEGLLMRGVNCTQPDSHVIWPQVEPPLGTDFESLVTAARHYTDLQ